MNQKLRAIYRPPAKMFIFERGWDLTFAHFRRMMRAARTCIGWCTGFASSMFKDAGCVMFFLVLIPALFFYTAGLALFLGIALLAIAGWLLPVALLLIADAVACFLIALLTTSSWLVTRIFGLHYRCANAHCYHEMPLPEFVCRHCSQPHSFLQPGLYGIFFHRCVCGKRLPTLDWLGRASLERYCAACKMPLDKEVGHGTNIDIPIIGGPGAGKTTYLVSATASLMQFCQRSPDSYDIAFTNPAYQRGFVSNLQNLQMGLKIAKTSEEAPHGYSLKIQRKGALVPRLLFFYDAAGEAFYERSKMLWHAYYKYIRGMIFVIDPYAIPQIRRTENLTRGYAAQLPGKLDVEQIGHRLIYIMETYHHIKQSRAFQIPLAVVITKVDIFGLERELGPTAIQQWIDNAPPSLSPGDAAHYVVREFLYTHSLNNLVDQLEQRFARVRYFSCSSLGMAIEQEGYHYQPLRVFEPLQWLLTQTGALKP